MIITMSKIKAFLTDSKCGYDYQRFTRLRLECQLLYSYHFLTSFVICGKTGSIFVLKHKQANNLVR